MAERAWSVSTAIDGYKEAHRVFAPTRGKAAYETLMNLRDVGYSVSFKHIRVRSLGIQETPSEIAQRQADEFNAKHPIGTPIRVYPGLRSDEKSAYDTVVKEPGAMPHNPGSSLVWVKVPGDRIALTHVVPLEVQS